MARTLLHLVISIWQSDLIVNGRFILRGDELQHVSLNLVYLLYFVQLSPCVDIILLTSFSVRVFSLSMIPLFWCRFHLKVFNLFRYIYFFFLSLSWSMISISHQILPVCFLGGDKIPWYGDQAVWAWMTPLLYIIDTKQVWMTRFDRVARKAKPLSVYEIGLNLPWRRWQYAIYTWHAEIITNIHPFSVNCSVHFPCMIYLPVALNPWHRGNDFNNSN